MTIQHIVSLARNKMFKLSYFIHLFLCFASSPLYAQQTEDYGKLKKILEADALTYGDSIGIAISEQDFSLKVDSLVSMIKQDVKFKTGHIILLVRVMNTKIFDFLISEEWKLIDNFYGNNFCEFLVHLNAYEHRRSFVFYSEKYDLFIGGRPHQNSRYRIIKE